MTSTLFTSKSFSGSAAAAVGVRGGVLGGRTGFSSTGVTDFGVRGGGVGV